jgi:hypothetical protein
MHIRKDRIDVFFPQDVTFVNGDIQYLVARPRACVIHAGA